MSTLNAQQRAAVRHIDGPLLVLAGAGSGKTRVITEKLAYLIDACGYRPGHLFALTFTNKAAREMKTRAAALLGGKRPKGLTVSTFHTLGLDMLRREHARLGYRHNFSLLDGHDSLALLRELMRGETVAGEDERARERISRWKSALVDSETALAQAEDARALYRARLYARYERALRAYNAVDLDDLVVRPVRLLQGDAEARERWQNRVRHLLVDEYQDTNEAQYQLVRLLIGVREGLTAVGDDDQSVYAWRGAQPENLAQLARDFPRLEVIKLEQSYRSTGRILKAANRLIAHNAHVFEKRLWSALGYGDPIRVIACRDGDAEAQRVVAEILHHRFTHRTRLGEYAILYRGNHQARPFERVLREHQIPYYLSGGTSFFERTEIKDVMAYLRLAANLDDDAAFLRIANTPRRELGPTTIERLGAFARERGTSLVSAALEPDLAERLGARPAGRVRAFAEWLVAMRDRAARGEAAGVARGLVESIDYAGHLRETSKDLDSAERRMQNVEDLLAWLERLGRREAEGDVSLEALVAKVTLLDVLEREQEEAGEADRVHLMTLHAAKGLEFPHVLMVGLEESLLPHRSSLEADDVAEERRLAYVGMTRARKTLTLTFAARRRRYGETVECAPSRFLAELPEEDVVWEGNGGAGDAERTRERGRAHLANLRGLLAPGT